MTTLPDTTPPPIYQLKVVLRHGAPMVWRRLLVSSTTTIAHLHAIIQTAMGWEDLHLHRFRIYGKAYGIYRPGGFGFADDPHRVCLAGFHLRAGERFLYEYDMHAYWQHDIWLERINDAEPSASVPYCIAGAGDCPPEDCDGPAGYRRLIRELASWDTSEECRADMLLLAERVLAFANGGPRPTNEDEDVDVIEALDRLRAREDWFPMTFDRRAVNIALRAMAKE